MHKYKYTVFRGGVFILRFCDVKRYFLGIFLIGVGIGILVGRFCGFGFIVGIIFIGVGVYVLTAF